MLMVVAGICAGEFFYMRAPMRSCPTRCSALLRPCSIPLSVYIAGLVGAMLVSLALLLALLVWYVFWLRAASPMWG